MQQNPEAELYSPGEIAEAAGVSVEQVVAALGGRTGFVPHPDAVRLGQVLRRSRLPLSNLSAAGAHPLAARASSLLVSSSVHGALISAAIVATLGLSPTATTLAEEGRRDEPMRMVFVATPGPGGGGGGGGLRQKAPPPKALREGRRAVSSPLPARTPPPAVEPVPAPPEPTPPPALEAEPLPTVVAPIVTAPADDRNRPGILEQAQQDTTSRGSGQGGGVGSGSGTGIGEGSGPGVGPGSGGGTGGGPYRAGSGILPPRLLREVKADYTDDARRRGVEGDVLLEIVVRRNGTVGDVKLVKRLGAGLDERAVQAVRQWQFAPGTRQGAPVDVIVEVAVAFTLR